MEHLLAVGCEGSPGGWVTAECVGESPTDPSSWRSNISLSASIADVAVRRGDSKAIVGMSVPMGLLDSVDARACDRQARKLLKHRWLCVYTIPSRPLLRAATYDEARDQIAELRETTPKAKGLSLQAFGLVPKMREADDWLRENPDAQDWLYEVHPELSFCGMAGHPLDESKGSWPGQQARMRLVERAFRDAHGVIESASFTAKEARLADLLNAYAVLYAALRVAGGQHVQLGGDADSRGLIMRMVF
jgi:predicted RNase H-like nuclease